MVHTIDRDRNTVVVIRRLREHYLEFTADRDRCQRKFMRESCISYNNYYIRERLHNRGLSLCDEFPVLFTIDVIVIGRLR